MPCSPTHKVFYGKCEVCLKRSFASSPRAANWSSKNELKPSQVVLGVCNPWVSASNFTKMHAKGTKIA